MNYPASMRAIDVGPIFAPQVTLLDTAVALDEDGRLTAVCFESRANVLQVDRQVDARCSV